MGEYPVKRMAVRDKNGVVRTVKLGGDAGGKRTCSVVVGTSAAGWTAEDCDYLCDGVDDQVEINAAIQAIPSSGGEVIILDGTYNVNGSSGCVNVIGANRNIVIAGNGDGTQLKGVISPYGGIIKVINASHVTIKSMKLTKGEGGSDNTYGVWLAGDVHNVRVEAVTFEGIKEGIASSTNPVDGTITDIDVIHCIFNDCNYAVHDVQKGIERMKIQGCRIKGIGQYGAGIGAFGSKIKIYDNYIRSTEGTGIEACGSYTEVRGNTILGCKEGIAASKGSGSIDGTQGLFISQNMISAEGTEGTSGIVIYSKKRVEIKDNKILGISGDAISISNCEIVAVSGNMITEFGTSATARTGIKVGVTVAAIITGNIVKLSETAHQYDNNSYNAPILLNGDNSIIKDNFIPGGIVIANGNNNIVEDNITSMYTAPETAET